MIGSVNVPGASAADMAVINNTLNNKVDKETGKGLSTNDYTTEEKTKLAGLSDITVDDALSSTSTNPVQNKAVTAAINAKYTASNATTSARGLVKIGSNISVSSGTISIPTATTSTNGVVKVDSALSSTSTNPIQNKAIYTALAGKVSTVSGKGLSTEDYTTAEKNKLAGLSNYDDTAVNNAMVRADAPDDRGVSQLFKIEDNVRTNIYPGIRFLQFNSVPAYGDEILIVIWSSGDPYKYSPANIGYNGRTAFYDGGSRYATKSIAIRKNLVNSIYDACFIIHPTTENRIDYYRPPYVLDYSKNILTLNDIQYYRIDITFSRYSSNDSFISFSISAFI